MRVSEGGSRVLEQGHRYADGGCRRRTRTRMPARPVTALAAPRSRVHRAPRARGLGRTVPAAGTDQAPRSFDQYPPDARVASVCTERRALTGTAPTSETATQ